MPDDGLPVLGFPTAEAFDAWVAAQPPRSAGLWLRVPRAGSGVDGPAYDQAVDVALRHGWIDGRKGAGDDTCWLQRFTPRRPRSRWSRVNRERAERLEAAGRLTPAGAAEVAAARSDGRWDAAYDGQRTAQVPADLQAALQAEPVALAAFEALDSANRYAVLYRVQDSKRETTRAERIARFVAMLARGQTLHPPRTRRSDGPAPG